MSEARAERQLQPVGDRDDVVREDRPVAALLVVKVVDADAVQRGADERRPAERNRQIREAAVGERRPSEWPEAGEGRQNRSLCRWNKGQDCPGHSRIEAGR